MTFSASKSPPSTAGRPTMTRKSEDDAAKKSDNVTHVVEVMSILDMNI